MLIKKTSRFAGFIRAREQEESEVNAKTRLYFSESMNMENLARGKAPGANLKLRYRKIFELSFLITLVLFIGAFQAARQWTLIAKTHEKVDVQIEVADIPPTEQFRKPPPPARPSMPIPSEEESIPEDLTIATTEIDLSDIPPPPAPPDEDDYTSIFVAYDEPPEIIGGMAALLKHLRYPRLAQAAGVEGLVFIKVLVGSDGRTEKAEVLKAKPAQMGFEEAALEAVMKVKWNPAKQRDKKIRVWVSIPVQFKLIS